MKTAVITMAYNEAVNLPVWAGYYGAQFGHENLFVLDHGSDDGSTAALHPAVNVIPVPRETVDEDSRVRAVYTAQHQLLPLYDWVIYTDADELLVPDPGRYASLADYLERKYADVVGAVGLNVIHQRHIEPPLDLSRKFLRQRSWVQFAANECKSLITRVPVSWSAGFHFCDMPVNIDPDLFLFHTKLIDFDLALSRLDLTRTMPWSENAVNSGHGYEHRYDRDQFIQAFFPDEMAREAEANHAFAFDSDLRRLTEHPGRLTVDWLGRIARIPERFRDIF